MPEFSIHQLAPLQSRFLVQAGQSCRLLETGTSFASQDSFVFIHGLFAAAEAFQPLMEILGQKAHCISLDLPGHGRTISPVLGVADFQLPSLCKHIAGLIETLKLKSVTLVGHSSGGLLALALIRAYPDLFERLVLINTIGLSTDVPENLVAMRQDAILLQSAKVLSLLQESLNIYENAAPVLKDYLAQPLVRRASQWLLEALIDANDHAYTFSKEELATVAQPTFIIWGEGDEVVPNLADRLLLELPDARLLRVDCIMHPHAPFVRRNIDLSSRLIDFSKGDLTLAAGESERLGLHVDFGGDYLG